MNASSVPRAPALAFNFCVTKYNPADRSDEGWYVGPENILSDHGPVETAYLDAISAFAADAGVTSLSIRVPEVAGEVNFGAEPTIDGDGLTGLFPEGADGFYDGAEVSLHVGRELVRAMLRDNGAWCRLEMDDRFSIHIGYDQYLYIGSSVSSERAVDVAHKLGLFVEPISGSPDTWDPDDVPYPPADTDFWGEVENLIAQRGPLLLEASAVSNQSRWHRLFLDNLADVRASLLPRSVVDLWPDLSTDITHLLTLLQDDTVLVVREDDGGLITSGWVDPDSSTQRAALANARAAAVMSIYAGESLPLLSAVLPDADGVIRARWAQYR